MDAYSTEQITALQRQFEPATPQEILRWAADTFGDRLTVVTSFQPVGIVTLHMLQDIAPRAPIITLDTGLLFPETYALIDEITARFNLNLVRVEPELTVTEQARRYEGALWSRDPDLCCHIRKTQPLEKALAGYDAWITGLRRDQSTTRADIPVIAWDTRHQMVKLCPFAAWTEDMVWTYLRAYELPYNILHDQGYPSIGCWPCTRAVAAGDDVRSGRWSGRAKTECGIHFDLAPASQERA
ncbi:MAG: phosphoadenylyl-sulfate reductase [Chloroflexi bacterium]|nr:phosphoadenylyl-sulfate reductase [Chloroflexota bacterium]